MPFEIIIKLLSLLLHLIKLTICFTGVVHSFKIANEIIYEFNVAFILKNLINVHNLIGLKLSHYKSL